MIKQDKPSDRIQTRKETFNILSSKLKSNNLSIKLNNYIALIDKPNQEASDFRPR